MTETDTTAGELARDWRARADAACRSSQLEHDSAQHQLQMRWEIQRLQLDAQLLAEQHNATADHHRRMAQIHGQLQEQLGELQHDAIEG